MKIMEKTPPQERVFLVEMTESELRYLHALVGRTTRDDDEALGFTGDGYELFSVMDDALDDDPFGSD